MHYSTQIQDQRNGRKLKVTLFCGGRGGKEIIHGLLQNPIFEITIIVNAYDDGLSTGYLRRIIPGFLGPSDVRKNMSYLMNIQDVQKRILKDIIEYRFPKEINNNALQDLENIIYQKPLQNAELEIFFKKISPYDLAKIRQYLKYILDHIRNKHINFDFYDCSLGNLLLAGCFLKNKSNFNEMIKEFSEFLQMRGRVLNVTQGENFVLTALRKDNSVLPSEASIVEQRSNIALEEIFLLNQYLKESQLKKMRKMINHQLLKNLRSIEHLPKISEEAKKAITESDIILYSCGTQNSSLYPTYLTKGFAEAIKDNKHAKKIFITNIGEDNEIPDATAEDLIESAVYYLNRKGELNYSVSDLIDYFFINAPAFQDDPKYVCYKNNLNLKNVIYDNFEKEYSGKHDGFKVMNKILQILHHETHPSYGRTIKKLSIVIPAYNEGRYILELLERIRKVDFSSLGVIKDIVVVDNGSTDNTYELLKDINDIKLVKVLKNNGKGDGVTRGIAASTGDIIVIQDADLEYNPEDLKEMLRVMLKYRFVAVYGSRTLKESMRTKALGFLYGKNPGAYWLYYLGGKALSFATFIMYGEYLSDTITGYKMVHARLLKSLNLKSKGFELDHEITAKILKRGFDIYEIPISYNPRTREQGKKIKWKDGFIALKTLLKFRFKN
jgi:2-phospho-L-lactate transferase/gluconeogenesis factor (CofD/UPF0052 family)